MDRWEPPHDPNETETRPIDFSERLGEGETVLSATWTSAPAGLTQVSASVSADGTEALWKFSGGTDGVDYEVLCRATTSLAHVLEETIVLRCRAR